MYSTKKQKNLFADSSPVTGKIQHTPMKIFRKITALALGLISIACATSCKKSLEQNPVTEYNNQTFWNEPAQAAAALTGAYAILQNTLNTEFSAYGEARADILSLVQENNTQSIGLIKNTLDPTMAISDWGGFYKVINQCNLVIKNVKDMNSRGIFVNNTTEYQRILGQAMGLRAYCYFYMTRVWGNIPLITEPTTYDGSILAYNKPRTDTLIVYKQVIADLIVARNLLPASYSGAQQTRATLTKGGIDAIMTDYYMWRSNIDSALITSKRVLDNTTQYRLALLYDANIPYVSLPQDQIDNTEYAKMFTEGFGPESIFEIAYNYSENTTSGLLTIFGGGVGVAQFYASISLISKFGSGDLRQRVDFKSDIQIFKNFPKGTFDRTTDNDKNVILYRLADIMLLRAEALLAKGDRTGAFTLVNTIRARAGANQILAATYNAFDNQTAKMTILDEREIELCFEGKRWFDLVRNGLAIPVMQPINGLSNPDNILFPISLNILRQNPQIVQNNFYK